MDEVHSLEEAAWFLSHHEGSVLAVNSSGETQVCRCYPDAKKFFAISTMDEIKAPLTEMPPLPPLPPPEMRRFGRFTIDHRMILENQAAVKIVLAGLIVTRAESSYRLDAIEYEAIGDDFREIPFGDDPPTYYPQLFRNEDGSITLTGWKEWIP